MKKPLTLLPAMITALTGVTLLLGARKGIGAGDSPESPIEPPPVAEAEEVADLLATPEPIDFVEPPLPPKLSYGLDEIASMVRAGVAPEVMRSFIESSSIAYAPNAADIVHLHELGASPQVVSTLIEHGGRLRERGIQESREIQARLAAPPATPVASGGNQFVVAPSPQPVSVTYNNFNLSAPPVPSWVGPVYDRSYVRYDCHPRYNYSSPRYYFPRYYFPTRYGLAAPAVGFRYPASGFVRSGWGRPVSPQFCGPSAFGFRM